MYCSSAELSLAEPTVLYNLLTRCNKKPAVLDKNYLLLLDVRSRGDYEHSHCLLARHVKEVPVTNESIPSVDLYSLPFGIDTSTVIHCVIYDSNTVSIVEDTPAVKLATQLAKNSRNTVMILKGGYERFSAEYPFLRTQKILYTPLELEHLPHYPAEIIPHFLYLGDSRHAYNPALNYDMKFRYHVNMSAELYTAFPGDTINELHVQVLDVQYTDLRDRFEEITEFIETCRKKSERVLVFGCKGMSRSVTGVMAYLIKYKHMNYKGALNLVKGCRPQVRPLQTFLDQLKEWETSQIKDKT